MPDPDDDPILAASDPIHNWFALSYAHYLTIPRSVLQSMDPAWQARFVQCLKELDAAIDWRPRDGRYFVSLLETDALVEVTDPLMDYERGRRRIAYRDEISCQT